MIRGAIATLLFIICFKVCISQNHDTIPTSIDLDEIIISANKTEEKKRTIAQPVESINRMELELLQAASTADVVASASGVTVQKSQQGGGSPVIRGFEASRVLLVIDGVRMNNLIYRAGHLQNIVTTDNSVLERIEILYGPSSTVYGSDALGGVIHLYTRQPKFAISANRNTLINAFTRYSSVNEEKTVHADINLGGKKFASVTSITFSDLGDLKSGKNQNPFYTQSFGERPFYVKRINGTDSLIKNSDKYLQKQSGYKQYDLLQKFAFRQNENVIHSLNLQYSTSSDIPRYDRLTDVSSAGGLRFAEWYYGPQDRLLTAYDVNISRPDGFIHKLHAGANFQWLEESRHTRLFNNPDKESQVENVAVAGVNVDALRITAKHSLRAGVDVQHSTVESTAQSESIETGAVSPLITRYPDGDNSMQNAALYFSHSWHVTSQLYIHEGLRAGISRLRSTFRNTGMINLPFTSAQQNNFVYSGSLGIVNLPSDDVKLSLLVSSGFRVPNIDDLSKVFESAEGMVIVPNPDVMPEKTLNYELGFAKSWNSRSEWNNAVYYTHFFDAIVTDRFNFNGQDSILFNGVQSAVYANQNKQQAYIYGFTSEFTSSLTGKMEFSLSANYTYGRIKTDSSDYPLDHIPPFSLKMNLSYHNNNFNAGFFIHYNGWKRMKDYNLNGEDNQRYATPEGMPAWFTANIYARYKFTKHFSLQAGIDNIFDTQYRVFSSGINAPGRNLFATLSFHY